MHLFLLLVLRSHFQSSVCTRRSFLSLLRTVPSHLQNIWIIGCCQWQSVVIDKDTGRPCVSLLNALKLSHASLRSKEGSSGLSCFFSIVKSFSSSSHYEDKFKQIYETTIRGNQCIPAEQYNQTVPGGLCVCPIAQIDQHCLQGSLWLELFKEAQLPHLKMFRVSGIWCPPYCDPCMSAALFSFAYQSAAENDIPCCPSGPVTLWSARTKISTKQINFPLTE